MYIFEWWWARWVGSTSRPAGYCVDPLSRPWSACSHQILSLKWIAFFILKQLHYGTVDFNDVHIFNDIDLFHRIQVIRNWLNEADTPDIHQHGGLAGWGPLVSWSASGHPSLLHFYHDKNTICEHGIHFDCCTSCHYFAPHVAHNDLYAVSKHLDRNRNFMILDRNRNFKILKLVGYQAQNCHTIIFRKQEIIMPCHLCCIPCQRFK